VKALVTGASGFIGSHIVRELLAGGHSVRALVRPKSPPLGVAHVESVTGDVADRRSLRRASRGCDVVFHTAGIFAYAGVTHERLISTLVQGTLNAVDAAAAAGVARFVLTSSSVTLGSSTRTTPRDEGDRLGVEPGPTYFRAKALQERAAFARAAKRGLPLVAVLPTMTVGANDDKLVPSNATIVRYLCDPYHLTFPGGCNIVAVRDVARGHLLAAERGVPGERYVLGSENLEWSLVHRIIAELCNVQAPPAYANAALSSVAAAALEWFAKLEGREPSVTRAEAETVGRFYWYRHDRASSLGYRPLPARRALAEATAWLIESRHLDPSLARMIRPSAELRAARRAHA
jgi:dihydroflavonol-4-reductase